MCVFVQIQSLVVPPLGQFEQGQVPRQVRIVRRTPVPTIQPVAQPPAAVRRVALLEVGVGDGMAGYRVLGIALQGSGSQVHGPFGLVGLVMGEGVLAEEGPVVAVG